VSRLFTFIESQLSVPALIAGLLPVFFLPFLNDSFVLPRTTLAVVGACLVCALALSSHRVRGGGLGALRVPAAAVLVAAVLAAVASTAPALSLAGAYARYESLPVRVGYVGLFWGTSRLLGSDRERRRVIECFAVGCGIAGFKALLQAHAHTLLRPDGELGQPGLLGSLLAMGLPLTIWLLVSSWRDRWASLLWITCLAATSGGLLASDSRSGWLGGVLGVAALLALSGVRRSRLSLKWAATLAGLLTIATAAIAAVVLLISPLRSLNSDTGSSRLHLWADSFHAIAARPITGWGEDTFGLVWGRYVSGDWEGGTVFDRVHSLPLDLVVTQGWLGLIALVAFWGLLWAGLAARVRNPVSANDDSHQLDPATAVLAALLAFAASVAVNFDWAPATAACWLLAGTAWSGVPNRHNLWRIPPTVQSIAGMGLGLAAIAFGLAPIAADYSAANDNPGQAIQFDPLQAQYHLDLGRQLVANGNLKDGVTELARAEQLGEYDPYALVALGDAQAQLGEISSSRDSYRHALELDPYLEIAREKIESLNTGSKSGGT
jgi:hypothetical protein